MSAVLTPINTTADPMAAAVRDFIDAKRQEDAAKARRLEAEARIAALHPPKEEGSTTVEAAGFKVTLTGSISYKADDLDALREITRTWDAGLVPIKTAAALDSTGCKWLRANRPDLWAEVARVITTSPAKTAVKVSL